MLTKNKQKNPTLFSGGYPYQAASRWFHFFSAMHLLHVFAIKQI